MSRCVGFGREGGCEVDWRQNFLCFCLCGVGRVAMLKMGTSEVGLEGKEVKICIVGEEGER